MALRRILTLTALAVGLTLCSGTSIFAQQGGAETPQQQRQGREGRRKGGPRGAGFGMRALRELNLSETQREQARAIFDRFAATIRPQREQLMQLREQRQAGSAPADLEERAKTLRSQIHEHEKAMRTELLGILTPEQRTQLEQLKQERKSRRDQRRQRRQGDQPETR